MRRRRSRHTRAWSRSTRVPGATRPAGAHWARWPARACGRSRGVQPVPCSSQQIAVSNWQLAHSTRSICFHHNENTPRLPAFRLHAITAMTTIQAILIPIISRCRVSMFLHAQVRQAVLTQLTRVGCAIGHGENPLPGPSVVVCLGFCLGMILLEEGIVALVIALYRRRMGDVMALDHRRNKKSCDDDAIRCA